MTFTNPVATPTSGTFGPTETVRCDTNTRLFKSNPSGCVYVNATKNILDLSKSNPTITKSVAFIQEAQKGITTHPGWFGHGKALTRLTSKTKISQNRAVARARCAKLPIPPKLPDSCDEYPFASTHQGAALVPRADVRVKSVPLDQNVAVGRDNLNTFYQRFRIEGGDSFYVTVTP